MNLQERVELYRVMRLSRAIDEAEDELTRRGEGFFHVSGAGHEAVATLAARLTSSDWLHCHYRDKALMLARGVTAREFFEAFFCNARSHSNGRQMSAHMSARPLNILSVVGPVGNNALQAVGVACAIRDRAERPIALCSVGDGTTQEGEFMEAALYAASRKLPTLFLIEDNHWAISTETRGKTFYDIATSSQAKSDALFGIPIARVDGRDCDQAWRVFGEVTRHMRETREPRIVVLDVDRLTSHTNADDQSLYRSAQEIESARELGDPLRRLRERLLEIGVLETELAAIDASVERETREAIDAAFAGPDPDPIFTAKAALPEAPSEAHAPALSPEELQVPMGEAIRNTLRRRLSADSRVSLFGQDIEDPKGDVFGVTKGLSDEFPNRVVNSPLAEATILGISIGRALAGEKPVAFIQFADFIPIAYNQIASELGSLWWRSNGAWSAPVIVMAACGGYRPGLGPFHAQTFESVMAHTPGIDVVMPSSAADAAGLLNAAFESDRPTIFLYPKSLLNTSRGQGSDAMDQRSAPLGKSRRLRSGEDLTLVGWGNTVQLCESTADSLEKVGVSVDLFDLRSISPWDESAILQSAERTGRLVVAHEDNRTCGFGAEVIATVAENAKRPIQCRRVTRPDTYTPCHFGNQLAILPSYQRILEVSAELLNFELDWRPPPETEAGVEFVEAVGSGPSDENVVVVELLVEPGDSIQRGQRVAALEASKSAFDLTSTQSGTIESVLVVPGDEALVGAPILKVRVDEGSKRVKPIIRENPGTPILRKKANVRDAVSPGAPRCVGRNDAPVGLARIATIVGERRIENDWLLERMPESQRDGLTPEDIIRRTGIESRQWVREGVSTSELGLTVVRRALEQWDVSVSDVDLLICATTTPDTVTPSLACQILGGLVEAGEVDPNLAAYDLNAACSGYLYALKSAYDYLQSAPQARVLIVTSEVLSPLLDPTDFNTAIIFGDAASVSLVVGADHIDEARWRITNPVISATADRGSALTAPLKDHGFIQMNGAKVFSQAVRSMTFALDRACRRVDVSPDDLELIVPHQANQRILDAVQKRVRAPVFSNVRNYGNTSSTSIPLALEEIHNAGKPISRIGLCAFGGGFTYAAATLESINKT